MGSGASDHGDTGQEVKCPPKLLAARHSTFITCHRILRRREEFGAFDQPAKFFLAGADVDSLLGVVGGCGFVFHHEPFQSDNAEIVGADFPDLGLSKFDGSCHTDLE